MYLCGFSEFVLSVIGVLGVCLFGVFLCVCLVCSVCVSVFLCDCVCMV